MVKGGWEELDEIVLVVENASARTNVEKAKRYLKKIKLKESRKPYQHKKVQRNNRIEGNLD